MTLGTTAVQAFGQEVQKAIALLFVAVNLLISLIKSGIDKALTAFERER